MYNHVGAFETRPPKIAALLQRWISHGREELEQMAVRSKALGKPEAVYKVRSAGQQRRRAEQSRAEQSRAEQEGSRESTLQARGGAGSKRWRCAGRHNGRRKKAPNPDVHAHIP